VRVAAIEPGAAPNFQMRDETRLPVEAALVERTQHVAGRGVADAPDLVIWPESSHPGALLVEEGGFQGALPLDLAPGVRLIVGALVIERRGEVRAERVWRPCAALLDERGNYLAHQDKLVCVPGGEAFPLARWLPFVRDLGFAFGVPHFTPGEFRPPLPLADGTLVGGVTCYENAFPWVAGRQVDAGARLLAVVTNEAWYHRGGELWQMDAMTVLRALETDTPVVRCTVDGSTIAVGSDGRFLARLPVPGAREPREPRILEVEIDLGPGALPPMAWMHPYWGWAFVLLSLIGNAHISGRGGKLLRLRQRDSAGAAPTSGDS